MNQVTISTDKTQLNIDYIQWFLNEHSHWAANRTRETINKSIQNSLCFGAYIDGKQIGFARVVSDYATFSWVCDVFSDPEHRGKGIGKQLVKAITEHPQLQEGLMLLKTKDAHELYERYGGFEDPELVERFMQRKNNGQKPQ